MFNKGRNDWQNGRKKGIVVIMPSNGWFRGRLTIFPGCLCERCGAASFEYFMDCKII